MPTSPLSSFLHRLRGLRVLTALLSVAMPLAAVSPSTRPTPTPLTVQLDWLPSAQFAGILVANQRGFYRRQHLAVTVLPADADMEPFAKIAASSNIVGVAEADSLLIEAADHPNILAFATTMQTSPFSLLTLKKSGLTTFKALKGKRIGLHGDGRRALSELLRYNGMSLTDVTVVEIPLTLDPLIDGTVDAIQGYTNDEVVRLNLQHHPVNVIPMAQNGYVSYAEVLFASKAFVHDNPDTLVRFLRATRQGWAWAVAHPRETAAMIVEEYMPGHSVREQFLSLQQVIPLLNAETHDGRYGQMSPETWKKSIDVFTKYQGAGGPINAEDLVTYDILNRLDGKQPAQP